MTEDSRFPTYTISDRGIRYPKGTVVRVIRTPGRFDIVQDPQGDYEVDHYRPSEIVREPMVEVQLRKIGV
jgi:hypothetical protein